jgi:hypothetical protein
MADLLECLIQIKALSHSIARLERLVADAPEAVRPGVDAVLDRLLDAERAYAAALRVVAAAGSPTTAAASRLERFTAARRAVLAALQQYSAADLGRAVDWPGRPGTSVADLVAIMLARDTERIGEIRRRVDIARRAVG